MQFGEELVVGDYGLVATFGDHSEVIQIFQQFFVVANGKNDGCAITALISEVLKCLAHGLQITLFPFDVEWALPWKASSPSKRWKSSGLGNGFTGPVNCLLGAGGGPRGL